MDPQTRDYYETHAAERVELWESAESPLATLLPTVVSPGQRVLDVGSGSGRDCAFLLSLGADAYGLEPVPELAAAAIARHPELRGRIYNGSLEDHAETHSGAYDGIILSAVLMHVPDSELFDFVIALRRLVKNGGVAVVSIPIERDDVDETTGRDGAGRLFVLRGESQVELFFERLGFVTESRYRSTDALRRNATWATLVFRYAGEAPRPIDRIEYDKVSLRSLQE